MRLAFLFIAEAYQLYHAAGVMFELMAREGVEVDVFHIDPTVPEHLELLRIAHDAPAITSTPMPAGFLGGAIQSVKLLGLAKPQVLAKNEARFSTYDAVISTEDGIAKLFADKPLGERPARIVITHGAGTRYFPSMPQLAQADLIVAKGEGDRQSYIDGGFVGPDQIVSAGYPKLVSTRLLSRSREAIFGNDNATVLYNPHKEPSQRSWDVFFGPLIEGFRSDRSRNLIVAPHVKLFRRRSERKRQELRALSDDTILVDPGSPRSLDNSYTEAADIYVGDVSSQVVEFLARPRPCVFLNAHGVDWRNDPHYALWLMGEVIEDPDEIMAAIDRAPALHSQYAERQAEFAKSALGDTSAGSIARSADLIQTFIRSAKA